MSDPTYFEQLGLPRQYDLNEADLERAYLERSRALHPDFHQLGSAAEQRVSLERTSLLNLAYTALKHPFRRAEYLLALEGGPSAAEFKQMAPEFLEEMLELRMTIQELREEGPHAPGLIQLEATLDQRRDNLLADLRRDFARLAVLPESDTQHRGVRQAIRQTLNAAKYIEGLLADVRAD